MREMRPEGKFLTNKLSPLSITLIYTVIGFLWIAFSSPLLHLLVSNPRITSTVEVLKGWLYVSLSAILLYNLIKRSTTDLQRSERELLENLAALEATHEELAATEDELQEKLLEVREQEARFRRIYEGVSSGVLLQDSLGIIEHANNAAQELLSLNPARSGNYLYWIPSLEVHSEDGSPFAWEELPGKLAEANNTRLSGVLRLAPSQERQRYLSFNTGPILDPATREIVEIVTTLEDITEKHRMDNYETLIKELDHLVLTDHPLKDVLNTLCRRVVEILDYTWAVIGLKNQDGSVSFPFKAGNGSETIDQIVVRWDESPEGQGAIGKAIRNGQAQIFDLHHNLLFAPWRKTIDKFNLNSSLVLPLLYENQVFGVLALYSQIPNYFEQNLFSHLERFADQIMLTIAAGKNREQLLLYNLLSQNTKDIILFVDQNTKILEANQSAIAAYGYTREELLSMSIPDLRAPDTLSDFVEHFAEAWNQTLLYETCYKRKDGSTFPAEVSPTATWLNGQRIQFAVIRDITARKQAEEALWLEKERAQVTLQSIGDAVITTDIEGKIEYLNQVAEELTGWTLARATGMKLEEVFRIRSEINGELAESPVTRCLNEGRIVGLANHTVLVHKDGHHYAIEDSAAPIRDRDGSIIGAVLVFHDVTAKRNLLRQMTHQAYHDSLTGLPNRLLFNDRLNQAISQAHRKNRKVAVLFLDLDRFKLVNDTLGHAVGDRLLQAVGHRLKSIMREGDTIGRQGGDEFIIILPEVSSDTEAGIVAQKLLSVFSTPFLLENEEVFITPSIGISLYPTDGDDFETLLKHADTAMYHAKESGRNNYKYFTWTLNATALERLELENSLRHALEREEFTIHYQPVVSLSEGVIVGVEALVRWNHPQKGLIPPVKFIPVAEDTGFIVPLGEWVLRAACEQASLWQKKGYPPLRLAVNLSGRQFRQTDLIETISQILEETGFPPQSLELELTESIVAQDIDFTIELLNQIKAMGIRISIDDFGTGFSSLSYLRRFPIDTLKIDKSFVWDIDPEHGDEIVTAIIALAQNLKLKVIAEGVETKEQLSFLKIKGCHEVQGYLFCQPVPRHEFESLLLKRKPKGVEPII